VSAGDSFSSLFEDFRLESEERLERLEDLLLAAAGGEIHPQQVEEIKLDLHTLKGNSGIVGLPVLQSLAHELEDLVESLGADAGVVDALLEGIDRFRSLLRERAGLGELAVVGGWARETAGAMRVSFSALDALVDLLGEMVIRRNSLTDALQRHRRELGRTRGATSELDAVQHADELLGATLDRLREGIMGLRMVPLKSLFHSLARIVHDECARAGKAARLETRGGDTPLDKALLEVAGEALGHLVRNAVIHGLESAEARERAGKGEGLVRVSAETDAREVRIDVLDDGGGIRRQEVAAEAARRGRTLAPGEDPTSLIFLHGFSTRQSADLSAGRGVGLAAVQDAVGRYGGRIEVFSEEGVGTLFRLHLPLSVSITRVLLVESDGEAYVLPLASVLEIVDLLPGALNEINGALVFSRRGELVPLLDLGYSFGTSPRRRRTGRVVVFEARGSRRAVSVEKAHGIREVVVRGLDGIAGAQPGVAGATILGDGRAVLILDPAGLMAMSPFGQGTGGAV
jgi:two-component system chemotaxis sensor kinase CheA